MKKIFLFIVFVSYCSFPQSQPDSNIFALQNSLKQINTNKDFHENYLKSAAINKKSPGLAVLYSFLLPGMGELYAGSYSSGKYFTIAEGALWGIFTGMNTYSIWLSNNYKAFAATSASVNNANKNSTYYSTIADYASITEYNNDMSLEGNFSAMLDPKTQYWNWPSTSARENYRTLWVASENENNDLRFVVGALILNRVVSAINAVRLVTAYNKGLKTDLSWNVSINVDNKETLPPSLLFNFQTEF
jgi:TM2 domain-containing membrane protein YozV